MNDRPTLVLIDGSAVFHRGYHAIPHLSNSKGEPTNAVYGFATILIKVLTDLKPKYVIVAWDKSSKTFRKDMYPEYKATRVKQPDDLYAQIPATRELVAAMGLPFIEVENYEADDIIGTLARKAEDRGDLNIVIATGDRDQLQLVDEQTVVDMFNPRGIEPTRYDLAKMQERYGLTPRQFIDYKALVGDTSDNIPGVKGIGDKGAMKLLADYQSLEGIYDHINEVTGKTREYLEASKDLAFLSRELSTIVCDMDLDLDLRAAEVGKYDKTHVHELFRRLEFRSNLLSKLQGAIGEGTKLTTPGAAPSLFESEAGSVRERTHLQSAKYHTVDTADGLKQLVSDLERQKVFAVDTETTSIDTFEAELVGISISWKEGEAYYIPLAHNEGTQLDRAEVLDALRPILGDEKIGKVGHNIKYDYEVLRKYDVTITNIAMDTMVAAFLLNSLGRSQSLDDLAYSELNIEMIPITELIGTGKNQLSFNQASIAEATTYAAEDADMTWRVYERLAPPLESEGLADLGRDMEWPLIPVLGEMEIAGIELDVGFLKRFGKKLDADITRLKEDVYKLAGEEFNLSSPAQLSQILYGRLGLSSHGVKKGKTGISTAAGELEKLRGEHPIIELIMQFRELDKLKNTYVDSLPELVKSDGRVHTSFNQTVAQTGRLSSTNPNLQNIPVRTELGREIRTAFVAPAGRVLVSADYSQIELRVAAALAHDEAMIQTFKDGVDLHQATAAELFGLELGAVTKEQRSAAKTINFGVLYGMSAHGLSVATGMDGKEAGEFINRYFKVRPKLAEYIEATKEFGVANGYTATLFGRRRPCPEIRSTNFQIRSAAERMAVNVPIQGTAADIYKLAMIAVARELDDDCQLLLQIHDELIVEAPEAKGVAVAALLKRIMEGVYDLGVPLAVDTAVGTNWGEV